MKKNLIRLFSLFLVCLLVCANAPLARAESINLGVDIQTGTDEITVTIDNSDDTNTILAAETPMLIIDCPFSPAHVKYGDTVVDSTLSSEGKISFRVAKGGAYKVLKGSAPPIPTYTVTFQSNGGSTVAPISGLYSGSKVTKPADPTRSGFTFLGWYQDSSCTNEWDFTVDTVSSDLTLYASWTEILPVVTSVTVTPSSAELKQGETQQFSAVVAGTNVASVAVTWTVTGAADTATTIDSTGKLTIGNKETADLTITAAAGEKTGTATVDLKQIYNITIGSWTKGSGKNLSVSVNAPADELQAVLIDGKALSSGNYTVSGTTGSTITLKNSYLKNLSAGTHSIEVQYEDGDGEETFQIKNETMTPNTGDFFNLSLWIGIMALCLAGITILIFVRAKRKV